MIPFDDIRVRRRRTLRLTAAPLATHLLGRTRTTSTLRALPSLLRLILAGDARLLLLLRHSAVIHPALLACRPRVRDNVVRGALAAALAITNLAIPIVGIRVLQDRVPGVQQAGEEAEAAEGDVDERVGGADAALYPHCGLS